MENRSNFDSICDILTTLRCFWVPKRGKQELTGITAIPKKVDGQSILSLFLKPDAAAVQARPLFWHYPHFSNQLGRPAGSGWVITSWWNYTKPTRLNCII